MIAISAAPPSVPTAAPLLSKTGGAQAGAFHRFLGSKQESTQPPAPKKKSDDPNNTTVVANVPTTLQTLLPITIPQIVSASPDGDDVQAETQKLEQQKPDQQELEPIDIAPAQPAGPQAPGELAFAARLADTVTPQKPLGATPAMPASKPQPAPSTSNTSNVTTAIPQQAADSSTVRRVQATPAAADHRPAASQRSPETSQPHSTDDSHESEPAAASPKPAQTAGAQMDKGATQATANPQPAMARDMSPSPLTSRSSDPAPAIQQAESISPLHAASAQAQAPGRLQDLSIRVEGPQQNSASIRLVDNGGELRVAVRSPDSQLADSLRANIDQLTSRLNSSGISAEVWRPGVSAANRSEETSQGTPQDRQNPSAQQWRGSNTRDQQNQNQQRPAWAEEFELWQ